MKNKFYLLLLSVLVIVFVAPGILAQTSTSDLWKAIPDEDLVASFNVRKIVNEALPRVLGNDAVARKDLENTIDGTRGLTGVDVRRVTRAVVGAKLAGSGLDVNPQDLLIVAEGEFNYADIKDVMKGPHREEHEEKYGDYTLLVFREYDDATSKKNEMIAVVILQPNLLAAGYLNAVKRSIDAFHDGKGRARADLIERAASAPDALVSVAARIPSSYMPNGTDAFTNKLNRLLSSVKNLEAVVGLTENSFPLTIGVRSETADAAADIKCMLESIRMLADLAVTDKAVTKVLDDLKITLDGNAALVQTEITVDQIRAIVNPPKPAPTTKPAKP